MDNSDYTITCPPYSLPGLFFGKNTRTLHRLEILRRIGLLGNPGTLSFQMASSFADLKNAYTLSYNRFLQKGYIDSNFMGMRLREWELNPGMKTFMARNGNEIAGIISLTPEIQELGLPSEWLFKEEISEIRKESKFIAESCNSAIQDQYTNNSIPSELYRCMLAYAWYVKMDKVIAVVNKAHKAFYEFLFMKQLGPEKSYSDRFYDPVVLIYTDCNLLFDYLSSPESDNGTADGYLRDYLLFKNPYIAQAPVWEKKAKRAFRRQRIRERFLDEIRNTLVASVWEETPAVQPAAPAVRN